MLSIKRPGSELKSKARPLSYWATLMATETTENSTAVKVIEVGGEKCQEVYLSLDDRTRLTYKFWVIDTCH